MSAAVVHGMANAEYHALQHLGASGLKKLARSPRHYHAAVLDPDRPIVEPSAAMKAGTLAHCHLLEPDKVNERYTVRPAWVDARTTKGKDWLLDNKHEGCEFVTEEQHQTAQRQAAAVRALPEIAAMLEHGRAEVSAMWTDEATGVECKCRPDWVTPGGSDGVVLLDLKTTKDASPKDFARSIVNFGYALQAAHYVEGYEQASGKMVLGMVFLATEAEYPHCASAYMLDEAAMAWGRGQRRRLLKLYKNCRERDHWPGYGDTIQAISLPRWAMTDDTNLMGD